MPRVISLKDELEAGMEKLRAAVSEAWIDPNEAIEIAQGLLESEEGK